MKGLGNCASKLQERLKWWHNNYHPIVSQDKEEIIKKYARTERPLPVICTNIQRYKELQADIQQEEFKVIATKMICHLSVAQKQMGAELR